MSLRLVEMLIPAEDQDIAEEMLDEESAVLDFWYDWVSKKQVLVKIIVCVEKSQMILDKLEEKFSSRENFRLLLFEIKATYPIFDNEEKKGEGEEKYEEKERESGISREELYASVSDQSDFTRYYVLLIAVSSIVAALGVLRNDIAIIIGAMVIAPLFGPNIALSLATTLADHDLARRALKSNLFGILLAFSLAILIGVIMNVDPTTPQIVSRSTFSLGDIVLALAAGIAGAIAFTRSLLEPLIGVMVALALLPALVTAGLLLGAGHAMLSLSALTLFLINLICINLAGVVTFFFQGIQPREWWEADKAKRASHQAMIIWIILLTILATVIVYTQYL